MTIVTIQDTAMEQEQRTWAVAEAKARFSELIDSALTQGPQTITRKGQRVAVIVAADEWARKTARTGTLADFFAASPLPGSGITIERTADAPRDIAL